MWKNHWVFSNHSMLHLKCLLLSLYNFLKIFKKYNILYVEKSLIFLTIQCCIKNQLLFQSFNLVLKINDFSNHSILH